MRDQARGEVTVGVRTWGKFGNGGGVEISNVKLGGKVRNEVRVGVRLKGKVRNRCAVEFCA